MSARTWAAVFFLLCWSYQVPPAGAFEDANLPARSTVVSTRLPSECFREQATDWMPIHDFGVPIPLWFGAADDTTPRQQPEWPVTPTVTSLEQASAGDPSWEPVRPGLQGHGTSWNSREENGLTRFFSLPCPTIESEDCEIAFSRPPDTWFASLGWGGTAGSYQTVNEAGSRAFFAELGKFADEIVALGVRLEFTPTDSRLDPSEPSGLAISDVGIVDVLAFVKLFVNGSGRFVPYGGLLVGATAFPWKPYEGLFATMGVISAVDYRVNERTAVFLELLSLYSSLGDRYAVRSGLVVGINVAFPTRRR